MAKAQNTPLVRVRVQGGEFLVCRQVGGWQDSATGIKIPGPQAIVDPITQKVIKLVNFPDPVQIPHHKMSPVTKSTTSRSRGERAEWIEWQEIDFFDEDELRIHDGLRLALDTGILEVVPDETVQSAFPTAWANRREKWTFEPRSPQRAEKEAESLLDLYSAAKSRRIADGEQVAGAD